MLGQLASELMQKCSCSLSVKYIAQADLSCDEGTTDRVVLRGALVGTRERSGAELHQQLQEWVDAGQMIQIIGIPLQVIPCSTFSGFEATCSKSSSPIPPTTTSPPSTSTSTTPVIKANDEKSQSSALGGVPFYAAVVGGVAFLVILTVVIVVLVVACKRCRARKHKR